MQGGRPVAGPPPGKTSSNDLLTESVHGHDSEQAGTEKEYRARLRQLTTATTAAATAAAAVIVTARAHQSAPFLEAALRRKVDVGHHSGRVAHLVIEVHVVRSRGAREVAGRDEYGHVVRAAPGAQVRIHVDVLVDGSVHVVPERGAVQHHGGFVQVRPAARYGVDAELVQRKEVPASAVRLVGVDGERVVVDPALVHDGEIAHQDAVGPDARLVVIARVGITVGIHPLLHPDGLEAEKRIVDAGACRLDGDLGPDDAVSAGVAGAAGCEIDRRECGGRRGAQQQGRCQEIQCNAYIHCVAPWMLSPGPRGRRPASPVIIGAVSLGKTPPGRETGNCVIFAAVVRRPLVSAVFCSAYEAQNRATARIMLRNAPVRGTAGGRGSRRVTTRGRRSSASGGAGPCPFGPGRRSASWGNSRGTAAGTRPRGPSGDSGWLPGPPGGAPAPCRDASGFGAQAHPRRPAPCPTPPGRGAPGGC